MIRREEEFTELERTIARQIMHESIMQYTTAGMLIEEIDHGIWVPCEEASSRMWH